MPGLPSLLAALGGVGVGFALISFVIAVASAETGSRADLSWVGANLVILVHGLTWLVYTHRKLSERNVDVTGLWSWLRGSPALWQVLRGVSPRPSG